MAIDYVSNVLNSVPHHPKDEPKQLVFDASVIKYRHNIPKQFIWPDHEKPCANAPELRVPLIDLGGFMSGDPVVANEALRLVRGACQHHGFFLVVNHGVDPTLLAHAHSYMDKLFELPLAEKQKAQRKLGEHCDMLVVLLADSLPSCHGNKLFLFAI